MTDSNNSLSLKNSKNKLHLILLFAGVALLIVFLHFRTEVNLRGEIPPHSDSLVYQNKALFDIHHWQKGEFSWSQFLFSDGEKTNGGQTKFITLPPLHKWSLQLGYLVFGINNSSPYIISGLWLALGALGIFLIVFQLTADYKLAFASGLLLMGFPAALEWGFKGTRNDWPAASLCVLGFYFVISSDFWKSRWRSLAAGACWGAALLVKGSTSGLLGSPALIFLGIALLKRHTISRQQLQNFGLSAAVTLLLAGWFYLFKYNDLIDYYNFWARTNLSNVKTQLALDSSTTSFLFYADNLISQLGKPLLFLIVLGLIGIIWILLFSRHPVKKETRLILIGIIVFAFSPYPLLLLRAPLARAGDIFMLPFFILLGVTGVWYLIPFKKLFCKVLLIFVILLNIGSLIAHNQSQYYQGIDTKKAADDFFELLRSNDYTKASLFSLYQDIYFNPETILNTFYRSPILRNRYNLSFPSVSLEAGASPTMSAAERFRILADSGEILLMSDRPKGLKWLSINQQWEELYQFIQTDPRFFLLGHIKAYDDGSGINVYSKQRLSLAEESDGWVINGAVLKLLAKIGNYQLLIEGNPHGDSVKDLSILLDNGQQYDGLVTKGKRRRAFLFEVPISQTSTQFKLHSNTPVIPRNLKTSTDNRELLFSEALVRASPH